MEPLSDIFPAELSSELGERGRPSQVEYAIMNLFLKYNGWRHGVTTILVASSVAFSSFAMAYTGEELAKGAKIDIQAARNIALKARPGKITDEELEKEGGGSGMRYSFDIKAGSITYEVGVDALTGKVLENKKEGKNPD